jgi:sugar/nucleoside kinase (ribokinase family)
VNDVPDGSVAGTEGARDVAAGPWDAVVVGAATRDIVADDRRGWRLGGAVAYAALTVANLGLRVAAIVGADIQASVARELDLLRLAGVDVATVPLRQGPVFENVETSAGRVQRCVELSDPVPASAAGPFGGDGDRGSGMSAAVRPRGWLLAPVADELSDPWANAIPAEAYVGLGWQGLLRGLTAGAIVAPRAPTPSPLVTRADLISVSQDDLEPGARIADLVNLIGPNSTLVLTNGPRGGIVSEPPRGPGGARAMRRYPPVAATASVDSTGAGDVFLAALFAARLEPRLVGGRVDKGLDILLAAAAASLVLEGTGLLGVPTRSAIRARMRQGLRHGGPPT